MENEAELDGPYVFGEEMKEFGYDPQFVSVYLTRGKDDVITSIRLVYARPKSPRYSVKVIANPVYSRGWSPQVTHYEDASMLGAEILLIETLQTAHVPKNVQP